MKMFIMRQYILLNNLLELIISYIIVDKAISWIENSSQYHNHA